MRIDHTAYIMDYFSRSYGPRELLADLDEAGFEKAVVMPGFAVDPDLEAHAKALQPYRGRLLGAAWINPHLSRAAEKLERAVKEWGFCELKIMPTSHYVPLFTDLTHPLMRKAEELRIPVTIHTGTHHGLPLELTPLAEQFSNVPIIMEHMGYRHFEPDDGVLQAVQVAKRHRNLYLDTTHVFNPHAIRYAVEQVGAERVIFGSETPIRPPKVCVKVLKLAGLTRRQEELILGENLERLLKGLG
ncbi:MAG: amidohydrolase family protein [Candidatus Bathyarchaeia archaeon]